MRMSRRCDSDYCVILYRILNLNLWHGEVLHSPADSDEYSVECIEHEKESTVRRWCGTKAKYWHCPLEIFYSPMFDDPTSHCTMIAFFALASVVAWASDLLKG